MRLTLPTLLLAIGCGNKDSVEEQLPKVVINEIVPSNSSGLQDATGTFPDWIELYNADSETVDVGGWYLTDDPGDPFKWQIPGHNSLKKGDRLVIIADSDPEEGPLHANFNLDILGEELALFGSDDMGNPKIDSFAFPPVASDYSWGRLPDGDGEWKILWPPTPAEVNRLDPQPPGGAP